ncbi:hypothetical protein TNCV_1178681 [Trichonephila clavipes]|nr:hypothetical protein TNCV_1178681 [Trichonephila clavipes]
MECVCTRSRTQDLWCKQSMFLQAAPYRNANYYKDIRNVTEALFQELGNIYVQEWQRKDWTFVANEQMARLMNNKT